MLACFYCLTCSARCSSAGLLLQSGPQKRLQRPCIRLLQMRHQLFLHCQEPCCWYDIVWFAQAQSVIAVTKQERLLSMRVALHHEHACFTQAKRQVQHMPHHTSKTWLETIMYTTAVVNHMPCEGVRLTACSVSQHSCESPSRRHATISMVTNSKFANLACCLCLEYADRHSSCLKVHSLCHDPVER